MNRRVFTLTVFTAWIAIVGLGTGACGPSFPGPTYPPNTLVSTVVDRGLAYGVPCKPPCWEGLRPGVSTENDLLQTLQRLRESGQIQEYRCSHGGCSIAPGPSRVAVSVLVQDGIVTSIEGGVGFDFDVQQLVDLIGPPTAVYPVGSGGRCHTCGPMWEGVETPIFLLYPDLGAWFQIWYAGPYAGCICPEMRVGAFEYLASRPTGELVDYMASIGLGAFRGVKESDLIEWHGFGPGY